MTSCTQKLIDQQQFLYTILNSTIEIFSVIYMNYGLKQVAWIFRMIYCNLCVVCTDLLKFINMYCLTDCTRVNIHIHNHGYKYDGPVFYICKYPCDQVTWSQTNQCAVKADVKETPWSSETAENGCRGYTISL